MLSNIIEFLDKHQWAASSLLVVLLLLAFAVVVYCTWMWFDYRTHRKQVQKLDADHGDTSKNLKDVHTRVAVLEPAIKMMSGSFDGMQKNIAATREEVAKISGFLMAGGTKSSPTAAASPVALTPFGRELADKLHADAIITRLGDKLEALVEERKPGNAYDIQEESADVCRRILPDMLASAELAALKNEAFQRGVSVELYLPIFSILLRDRILAKKGIAVAEVDKHQPPPPVG